MEKYKIENYPAYKNSGLEWLGELEMDYILVLEKERDGLIREIIKLG